MEKNVGWAFVGSIPIIGFVLVLLLRKSDKFAMFYAKEGLVLGILAVIINAVLKVMHLFSILYLVNVAVLIVWIIIIVNLSSKTEKPTPVIGDLAKKIKL